MSAMKRAIVSVATLLVLTCDAGTAQASIPLINLEALGIELCPQSFCGAAIFVGLLHGQVDNRSALGTFALAVNHDELPTEPLDSANLHPGGAFEFRFGLRRIRGEIVEGLIVRNDIDDPNTFSVGALLNITSGGSGTLLALIRLDHNVFPPRVSGEVFSCPGCAGFAFQQPF